MILRVTRFVNLLLVGLLAGALIGLLVVEIALLDVSATVYTTVQQPKHEIFEPIAVVYVVIVLSGLLVLFLTGRESRSTAFVLTLAGVLFIIVSIITTVLVNVPINTEIIEVWSAQSPPADWTQTRDRWNLFHAIRTVLMVAAFVCLLTTASTSSRRSTADG